MCRSRGHGPAVRLGQIRHAEAVIVARAVSAATEESMKPNAVSLAAALTLSLVLATPAHAGKVKKAGSGSKTGSGVIARSRVNAGS